MPAMTTAERRGYQQICRDDGAMMVIAATSAGDADAAGQDAEEQARSAMMSLA